MKIGRRIASDALRRAEPAFLYARTAICASAVVVSLGTGNLAPPVAFAEAADAPVATIDGQSVTGADYRAYLAGYMRSKLYHGGSPERVRELADEALENLILDRLLAEAADERGIEGDPAVVTEKLQEIRTRYGSADNWPQIEARLPEVEQEILTQTRVGALRREVMTVAPPDEATLRSFHAKNPTLFTEPKSWDLDLILIGVPPSGTAADWVTARETAETILAEFSNGQAFSELAAQHSSHGSAAAGGNVGRVHGGQLPDELEAAVEKTAEGSATQPVRVLEGYAIARVNTRHEERQRSFEEVRDRVAALYERQQSQKQWSDYIAQLRADASVETFDLSRHVRMVLHEN